MSESADERTLAKRPLRRRKTPTPSFDWEEIHSPLSFTHSSSVRV